jgi:radical SAM protein with 4Fe4S-binding SPASM domain
MSLSEPKLTFTSPDWKDTRGGAHLMVWGNLGTWLVMDDELRSLIERFDGRAETDEVFARHAAEWGKRSAEAVRDEALPFIRDFVRRGVLSRPGTRSTPDEEPLSIANVTFNITNRCNLSCPFCYNGLRDRQEVAIDDVVRFLRAGQKVFSKDASLIVLGGEPLLVPERLFALIDRAGGLFSRPPMISTNGTRLNDAMVARLAKARIEVQVSLDSADEATHDRGRGKGVYAKAVAGIRRLVDAGVYTIMSMVIKKSTLSGMADFLALSDELKVDEARFIPLRQVGAVSESCATSADLPDPLAGFEQLTAVLEAYPEYGRLLARDFFSIAAVQCRFSSSRVSCGIGRRVIFIDADGGIYPCPNHVTEAFRVGNITTDVLENVLEQAMAPIRARYHIDLFSRCRTCPFRRWCAGDCRGEVVATTSDPAAPSPHCNSLRTMYKRILWRLALNDGVGNVLGASSRHNAKNTFL